MEHKTSLTSMMLPEPAVMNADEPMRYARRRMQTEALHSIIIVQDNRPVGIVESRHLRGVTSEDLSRPVSDFMIHEVPVLRGETTPDEAVHTLGHDVEVDQFPVVRDDGTLAGVVTRATLLRYRDHGSSAAHVEHATMSEPVSAETGAARVGDTHFDLRDGMSVEDVDAIRMT
jgi:CBS domain-containing protein